MKSPEKLFLTQLKKALAHIADPAWLTANSPLATAYFLGAFSKGSLFASTGELLREALLACAATLWGGPLPDTREQLLQHAQEDADRHGKSHSSRYQYLLLELQYFRQYFPKEIHPQRVEDIHHFLYVGRSPYFTYIENARAALGRLLMERFRPNYHLEHLPEEQDCFGRHRLLADLSKALTQGAAVTLTGQFGVGKTTVATTLALSRPEGTCFWYTIRPNINDNLFNVTFSLAQFLQQHGSTTLLLYLQTVQPDKFDPHLAVGYVHQALQETQQQYLFIFDEVDLLCGQELETPPPHSQQIVEFLEGLRGRVPLLLVGQRAIVDTPNHHHLQGLSRGALIRWLQAKDVASDEAELDLLLAKSGGNPRLISLMLMQYRQSKRPLVQLLSEMPRHPSLRPILMRLWKHLSLSEQRALLQLSVFRSAVSTTLPVFQKVGARFWQLGIVERGAQGSCRLPGYLRTLLRELISADSRAVYHEQAAIFRATYGEYTSAAWHYREAGEETLAVRVWYPHREVEIELGMAHAARNIFSDIPTKRVENTYRRRLITIRQELLLLDGDVKQAVNIALPFDKAATTVQQLEEQVESHDLLRRAHETMGQYEKSLEHGEEAIVLLERILLKILTLRWGRVVAHRLTGDIAEMQNEVALAEAELAFLKAYAGRESGDFERAEVELLQAMKIAREHNNLRLLARISRELATLYGSRGEIEQARQFSDEASLYYRKIGNLFVARTIEANLGGMYLQVGEYERTVETLEPLLQFFRQAQNSNFVASISSNLAEAYFHLGRTEEAKRLALSVLQLEEVNIQPYALYTLALVYAKEGKQEFAEKSFTDGICQGEAQRDRFILAYLHREFGRFLQPTASTRSEEHLEKARDLFTEMNLPTDHEPALH